LKLIEQGTKKRSISVSWSIDMRYSGQSHEIPVPIRQNSKNLLRESLSQFESQHQNSYGYIMEGRNIKWVTARVAAASHSWQYRPAQHKTDSSESLKSIRHIVLHNGKKAFADVFRKNNLNVSQRIEGPSIIEQFDTTVYIAPDWCAELRMDGTFLMRRERA
jgi:N-methylhydantoinase A